MPFTAGTFSATYNFVTESAAPPIEISKLQEEFTNFAAGLSACILRDGTGLPTAAIPFNSQRLTSLGSGTARTDAINVGQAQDASTIILGSVAGTNTITGNLTPAISSYASRMLLIFTPANANTGASTINVNGVGSRSVVKGNGNALVANDLLTTVPAVMIYDGASFVLLNPQSIAPTAAGILAALITVDGAGSGLDADLLDGNSSAAFAAASHTHGNGDLTGYTAADVLTKLLTVDGAGSGLDADLLDGQSSAAFAAASHTHANGDLTGYTAADVLSKLVTVDGSGSGLDADTVDGLHSSSFVIANSSSILFNDVSGFFGIKSFTVSYERFESLVVFRFPADVGTSDATTFVLNVADSQFHPSEDQYLSVPSGNIFTDNGSAIAGSTVDVVMRTNGNIEFNRTWTASGNKGFAQSFCVSIMVD